MLMCEMMVNEIVGTYEKLETLPRPASYKIGGEYFGGTQLFKSVGNMLDLIKGESYIQYDGCGTSTQYQELFGIRIGGAYKDSESRKLIDALTKKLVNSRTELMSEGFVVVDDYGTNFSVIGIARR